MKKFLVFMTLGCMLFSMAGCKNGTPAETGGTAVPTSQASPSDQTQQTDPAYVETTLPLGSESVSTDNEPVISQKIMYTVSLPVSAQTLTDEDGNTYFYSKSAYMDMVHPDQGVANKIIVDFQSRMDQYNQEAASLATQAEANGSDLYFYITNFIPTRIDGSVLSLNGETAKSSGSRHSDRVSVCANYDMVTGDVLTLASILYRDDCSDELCQLLLTALEESEYAQYLQSSYTKTVSNRFSSGMSSDEDWYFDLNGLTFCFSPSEIAPNSMGIITATIPYEQLTGIISDSYFPPETDTAAGQILSTALNDDINSSSQFTQMAEITTDLGGDSFFLYTDSSVRNVRIELVTLSSALGDNRDSSVIFATGVLTPGDAIRVEAQLPEAGTDSNTLLKLTYTTGTETVSKFIYKDVSTDTVVFTD